MFVDLVAAALGGAHRGRAAGDDRYLIHLVRIEDSPGASLIDADPSAQPAAPEPAATTPPVTEEGEPLALGRKTRDWTTAPRRGVTVRDGGHCRFPGCMNRFVDIHHIPPWNDQGRNDIDNAMSAWRRHHRLIHHPRLQRRRRPQS